MNIRWVLLIPALVYTFLLWVIYLLVAHPRRYVELFLGRIYRSWGVTVTVTDEAKLARRTRRMGVLLLLFVIAHATLVFTAVLRCPVKHG